MALTNLLTCAAVGEFSATPPKHSALAAALLPAVWRAHAAHGSAEELAVLAELSGHLLVDAAADLPTLLEDRMAAAGVASAAQLLRGKDRHLLALTAWQSPYADSRPLPSWIEGATCLADIYGCAMDTYKT